MGCSPWDCKESDTAEQLTDTHIATSVPLENVETANLSKDKLSKRIALSTKSMSLHFKVRSLGYKFRLSRVAINSRV